MIMSMDVLKEFRLISNYVKRIRFDDVYIGILANKLNITPVYTTNIVMPICNGYLFGYLLNTAFNVRYGNSDFCAILASHCYGNPDNLERAWTNCNHYH